MVINTENINEARKQIDKLAKEGKPIIIIGKTIDYNRLLLESKKINTLILTHKDQKDRMKQRESGLNQVLCKIAKENNVSFAIDLKELTQESKKERAEILARIIQNITLIKKYNNKLKLINYTERNTAFSFLITLGLPTNQAKEAVN